MTARMIAGRLAFEASGSWWSRPDCFYTIDVQAEDGSPADATMWSDHRTVCNAYPAFYGVPLEGEPYRGIDGTPWPRVGPRPLRLGVTYSASVRSPGSSYGTVRFRLDDRGGVQVFDLPEVEGAANATSSTASP